MSRHDKPPVSTIFTRFVNCSRAGGNGTHPITIAFTGDENGSNTNRLRVVSVCCACDDDAAAETVQALGGETCCSKMRTIKKALKNRPAWGDSTWSEIMCKFGLVDEAVEGAAKVRENRRKGNDDTEKSATAWEKLATKAVRRVSGIDSLLCVQHKGSRTLSAVGSILASKAADGAWELNDEVVQNVSGRRVIAFAEDRTCCVCRDKEHRGERAQMHHADSGKHREKMNNAIMRAFVLLRRAQINGLKTLEGLR